MTQNYNTLFIYAVICFGLALLCTSFVKHGEFTDAKATDQEGLSTLENM